MGIDNYHVNIVSNNQWPDGLIELITLTGFCLFDNIKISIATLDYVCIWYDYIWRMH